MRLLARAGPALLLALAGCSFEPPPPRWWESLQASGPCYEVDIRDGLDESSMQELNSVFDCFNQEAGLAPLQDLFLSLENPTRTAPSAGVAIAGLVNLMLFERDLKPLEWIDELLLLIEGTPPIAVDIAELGVELVYATPYDTIATQGSSSDPESIDQGIVAPLLDLSGPLVSATLDTDLDLLDLTALALRSERAMALWMTLDIGLHQEQGPLATLTEQGPALIGRTLQDLRDESNNMSRSLYDDSLQSLASAAVLEDGPGGRPVVEELLDPLATILESEVVRVEIEALISDSWRNRDLDLLLPELLVLMNENIEGEPLSPTERSAFAALVELFHVGDQNVSCSVIGYEIDISDNFSAWILKILAEQDPATVSSALRVLGVTLDWGLFLDLLGLLSESCDIDSETFVADLPALQRLVDPGVGDFTTVLLTFLAATHPSDNVDLTPEVARILSVLHESELVEPIQELTRDVGNAELARLVIDTLPVLLDPWGEQDWCKDGEPCDEDSWRGFEPGSFPAGTEPLDFHSLCDLIIEAREPDTHGRSPMERLHETMSIVVEDPSTWLIFERVGALLREPGSRTLQSLELVSSLQDLAEDTPVPQTLADWLDDRALILPLLEIVEVDPIRSSLQRTTAASPGPLPFLSNLVVDGTLSELLRTLRVVISFFQEASE